MVESRDRDFVRRFGRNLRRVRLELDLSQEEIAERAGITNKYLSEIENGKRSVRLAVAHRLSHALGKTLDELSASEAAGKPSKSYQIEPRLTDLLRRLETAEKRRAYGILKAAFKD
ncbi:MAG: helix-turn-helix transcriptional regulator [Nitrospirae bacterium]|nr:helix-turn-helix transcriptional regulator [Nitrospirota bacterium]